MTGQPIPPHSALIYLMVTVAASDGRMGDAELNRIGEIVRSFPIFEGYNRELLIHEAQDCAEILQDDNGLSAILGLLHASLPDRVRDTAYTIACEVAGVDGRLDKEERRVLDLIRETLGLERLLASAIERAAAARGRRLPNP
jgi:tellurite resistance protein